MEEPKMEEQEVESSDFKTWLQDNFRVILSILVVIAIAGGIYSYSKRAQLPTEEVAKEESVQKEENIEIKTETSKEEVTETAKEKKQVASVSTSQETENSFVETAGRGDGKTHLARRALANYLEKNPDSSLTREHKIYIEDYLRKKVGNRGGVRIGTSIEFSKDLIRQAIESSKKLNERQLKNLQKYSARVPSLS